MEGYNGFQFMKKLHYVKQKLRVWNKNTFGKIKEKKDSIWKEVEFIDKKIEEDGQVDSQLKIRWDQLMADMESVLRWEDIFWSQKAKCKWLKEGNGNTNYFHRVANGRKRKNTISYLLIQGQGKTILARLKMKLFDFSQSFIRKMGLKSQEYQIYSLPALMKRWPKS